VTALQAALQLAEEHGLPVLPCRDKDEQINGCTYKAKSPYLEHGFKDASRSIEQIAAWWKRWPDALIGVPTGTVSNIFAIDVDTRGLEWYREHATELASGRVHKTRRGYHLLYKHPAGLRNSSNALADGVDTRGDDGYIVWWPAHGGEVTGDDIGELPAWAEQVLRARTQHTNGANAAATDGAPPDVIGPDRSADLLARVAKDVRDGRANYEIVQRHISHPHAVDQADPKRAVERCIEKARTGVPAMVTENNTAAATSVEQQLIWFNDFRVHTAAVHLVRDIIPEGALVNVFGDSNTGKSTLKIDMLLSIAHGLSFRGLKTRPGLVIYLAGEGSRGVEHRAAAWRLEHPNVAPGPFAMWPDAVNFRSLESVTKLIERIREAETRCGQKCVAIAVDTLMRCLFGSDNDPEHMAEFIAACDHIRHELGCAVIVIHHSGKDTTRGARGHSMLRAAVDTEIEVTGREGVRFATITKQRDILTIPPMAFELRSVMLGLDESGNMITACVIDHKDVAPPSNAKGRGRNQERIIVALKEWLRAHPDATHISSMEVFALCKAQGVTDRRRRTEVLESFVNTRILSPAVGGYTLHGENL
jgi:hypothetical protein